MRIHIVQEGDSLWSIAKKYDVDFEEVQALNNQLENENNLMPGMKIYIPEAMDQRRAPFLHNNRSSINHENRHDQNSFQRQVREEEAKQVPLQPWPSDREDKREDLREGNLTNNRPNHQPINDEYKRDRDRYSHDYIPPMICSYCMQPLPPQGTYYPSYHHPHFRR